MILAGLCSVVNVATSCFVLVRKTNARLVSPVRISRESLLTGVFKWRLVTPAYKNCCPMSRSCLLQVYYHSANLVWDVSCASYIIRHLSYPSWGVLCGYRSCYAACGLWSMPIGRPSSKQGDFENNATQTMSRSACRVLNKTATSFVV